MIFLIKYLKAEKNLFILEKAVICKRDSRTKSFIIFILSYNQNNYFLTIKTILIKSFPTNLLLEI